jgi:outer membrane lipoprotein-sorting protein
MIRFLFFLPVFLFFKPDLRAQPAADLVKAVQEKLARINDYRASAYLKTNIHYLTVPDAEVTVFYKKPNHLRIRNEKGISLVPKESVSISLYSLLSGQYQVLDAGTGRIGDIPVRIVKLLPENENADLVLSTLYIDAARLLVLKAKITTRENGTDEVTMTYGKYAAVSLPDKVVFSFNTREYKLPKGVTFDYDDGSRKNKPSDDPKNQRGKIELNYSSYEINKGLGEEVFK